MYLFVDNSNEKEIILSLKVKGKWLEKRFKQNSLSPKPLLFFLEKFLKVNRQRLSNLSGIAVLLGRGRFTATRIAVTTANALSYALNIPAVGVAEFDRKLIENKLKSAKPGIYLSAKYSGQANVGKLKV